MLLFIAALLIAVFLRKVHPSSNRQRPVVRWIGLPVLAAALQLAIGVPPLHHLSSDSRFAVVLVSYGVVGFWLVVNAIRQMPGLRFCAGLISLGWLANVVAIVANRGMPVSPSALARIGVRHSSVANGNLFKHVLETSHTVVPWLGDVIPIAVPVLKNVISVGDILVVLGAMLAVQHVEFPLRTFPRKIAPASRSEVVLRVPNSP
jgi:hypothetical protein